jgi:hypothetical protein
VLLALNFIMPDMQGRQGSKNTPVLLEHLLMPDMQVRNGSKNAPVVPDMPERKGSKNAPVVMDMSERKGSKNTPAMPDMRERTPSKNTPVMADMPAMPLARTSRKGSKHKTYHHTETKNVPSRGSKNHSEGMCRPCRDFASCSGCSHGVLCNFCHYPHPEILAEEALDLPFADPNSGCNDCDFVRQPQKMSLCELIPDSKANSQFEGAPSRLQARRRSEPAAANCYLVPPTPIAPPTLAVVDAKSLEEFLKLCEPEVYED